MSASFIETVAMVLDFAGIAHDSPAGRYAMDRVPDVGAVVAGASMFARHYKMRTAPRDVDPEDAAINLAILAIDETTRGVRVIPFETR